MSYVLRKTFGIQRYCYVNSDKYMHLSLSKAKVFKNKNDIKKFRNKNGWYGTYAIIEVTKKQLFKAKLKGE